MVTMTDAPTTCSCCESVITPGGEMLVCPTCRRGYHRECWEQQGGCQTEGCTRTEETTPNIIIAGKRPILNETQRGEWFPWTIIGVVMLALILIAIVAVHLGANANTVLIVGVVIAALSFDYVNGMHDAGNAIATVISTRVLTPTVALIMAATLNLIGALVHSGVAKCIAEKFADMQRVQVEHLHITPVMILCGLIGASAWSFLTARWGLPVSTSHSLFGGLIGVFLLGGIPLNYGYLGEFALFMVLAPVIAFTVGWALMMLIMTIFRNVAPHKINQHFRGWQVVSSAAMAFSHGSNDAQKAMGIITLALVTGGFLPHGADIPFWVKLACALVIAVGTGIGGMRVIKTLGHKIIKLQPVHGFAAETVAAITIQLVTILKVPISTTHVISSSILGIGASKRLSAVRWGVASSIVMAWVFTIPTCAMAGALLYFIVKSIGSIFGVAILH